MSPQKYEKPFNLDMGFEEAVKRYSGADPNELRAATGPRDSIDFEKVTFLTDELTQDVMLDPNIETIWASVTQISELYGKDTDTISEHIQNIYKEGELEPDSTTGKFPVVRTEGKRQVKRDLQHYNLDMILSVGYRTHSRRATEFRIWSNKVLKAYIVDGFALNESRLKNDPNSLRDLAAEVRALRSGEKQIYQAVRDCFKISSTDYKANSKQTKSFYAKLQDKFLYAVTEKTAADIILQRADHEKEDMGLTHMRGDFPDLWDAKVGKNYLENDELYGLHILCEQFLLFAESKALRGQPLTMNEMASKFDELLAVQGAPVFSAYKGYLAKRAQEHAKRELELYKKRVGYVPKSRTKNQIDKK